MIKLKPPVIIDGDEIFGRVERQMPSNCQPCGAEVVNRIVHRLPANDDTTPVEERARMKALQREAEREKESSGNGNGAEPH